jgi:nicotinate-nucleotide pyrophosphorylase (carboxylating)
MLEEIINNAFKEDVGDGDHSSLSCVPAGAHGEAKLLVKGQGIIAGVTLAAQIFHHFDPHLQVETFLEDGAAVKYGDIAFVVKGLSRSILSTERIVLNFMQRMSGIATLTHEYVKIIEGTDCKLLDTRKTTPGIRLLEKWAVRIGGGHNHRFGLYDMIMIKDNHIDYAGGIAKAIQRANEYNIALNKNLKIEIEVRNEKELHQVLEVGGVDRIMLDNFTPAQIKQLLPGISKKYETEASGGITKVNLRDYAETGVDFISVGALTHSYQSLDMSLKAVFI